MNWWLFGPLLWVGLAVLLGGAAALSGRWYRSSDRQTELDRMIRKQRRRDGR